MDMPPQAMHRFNAISIEISTQFFSLKGRFSALYGGNKNRIAKTILNNKRTAGGLTTPFNAIQNYNNKNSMASSLKRNILVNGTKPHTYGLIFGKVRNTCWKKRQHP